MSRKARAASGKRLHYDWSDPNRVVLTTTDSNTWGGASGHTYTFKRQPNGTTDIDLVVVRDGKNLKGRVLASCSEPLAGASWKGHLKTPSRPSKLGTTRLVDPDVPTSSRFASSQKAMHAADNSFNPKP